MKNCKSWLLILSVSIVGPPPRINRGNHLFMWKLKLTVDPLNSDHWSPPGSTHEVIAFSHKSESWLLILSLSIIDFFPQQSEFEFYTFFPGNFEVTHVLWISQLTSQIFWHK